MKCLACLLLLAIAGHTASASWKVAESQSGDIHKGMQLHRRVLTRDGFRVTLHAARFHADSHHIRVVDFDKTGPADVADAARRLGGVAAINAGYFHADNAPVGLVVSGGRILHPQERANLLTGVFAANAERAYLLRPNEFKLGPRTLEAVQAGPFLVDRGKVVQGLNNVRRARRSFILTDGKNQWAIGVCFSATLAELGDILATDGIIPGIRVQRALNLDGGSSTGFWVRRAKAPLHLREIARVRNALVIVPK